MKDLENLRQKVVEFRNERDWEQFHNPKDLVQAISIEASELSEIFLWVSQSDSYKIIKAKEKNISEEMADILIYLLSLSDITGINLGEAVLNKLEINKKKYPVEKSRGSHTKYTHLK